VGGALDGTLVLDATASFWASLGTGQLADFGARVIRLEGMSSTIDNAALTTPAHNELANRNKQSARIDITHAEGRRVFEQLVAKADVFAIDAPRGAIEEQRLDYPTLAALKPDLIYARASGFGPDGPGRDLPALDELAAARTGLMPILPQPGQPPVYGGAGQMYSSVMLAFGVMLALWHRDETGEGQEVDTSLFAGNMYGASLDIQAFLAIGGERFLQPVSRLDAGNPMSGTLYPTSDGLWVTLTMPDTDRWWPGLAAITGLDEHDPCFDTHEKRCETYRLELIAALEEAFQKKNAAHWRDVIAERGLSADVIEEYSYPATDEQVLGNNFIIEQNGSKTLGFPLYMSETPAELRSPAPTPGEHTADVLRELLGYSDDQIAQLRSEGAVT
jgi:formyl-CoA transferase